MRRVIVIALNILILNIAAIPCWGKAREFSHSRHKGAFEELGVRCTECHLFNVKLNTDDVTESGVGKGHLKVNQKACMACHGQTANHEFLQSCAKCHSEQAVVGSNHPNKNGCTSCHLFKGFEHKTLQLPSGKTCLGCHQDHSFKHRSVANLAETSRGLKVLLDGKEVSCKTCHRAHQTGKSKKLLIDQKDVMSFCTSCHSNQVQRLHKSKLSRQK